MRPNHPLVAPREFTSADELAGWYDTNTGLTRVELNAAIPAAIDASYAARDADLTMHHAGAAAAVAALEAARRAAYEAQRAESKPRECMCGAEGVAWHHPECPSKNDGIEAERAHLRMLRLAKALEADGRLELGWDCHGKRFGLFDITDREWVWRAAEGLGSTDVDWHQARALLILRALEEGGHV